MKNLPLSQAFRFAFPGFVLYLYIYFLFPTQAINFAKTANIIGFPLILIVIGSVIYFLYRPLLYDSILIRLLALWSSRGSNYQLELISRYGISFTQATHLFIEVRETHLIKRYTAPQRRHASGIHMTYQIGFLALAMACVGAFQDGLAGRSWLLFVFGVFAIVGGFLNDKRDMKFEHDMLMEVGWEKIDIIAAKLDYMPIVEQAEDNNLEEEKT